MTIIQLGTRTDEFEARKSGALVASSLFDECRRNQKRESIHCARRPFGTGQEQRRVVSWRGLLNVDLINIKSVSRPATVAELPRFQAGDVFLAGGTWLFSEAQSEALRLIDLTTLPWPAITVKATCIEIAATCTYETLLAFDWSGYPAATLFFDAVHALSSSFKTYSQATVGGNLCLAFAKGVMAPVFIALGASYELRSDGGVLREVPAETFQLGIRKTILGPGEYLAKITVPISEMNRRFIFRSISYTATSHVIALVIAGVHEGAFQLICSGAITRPGALTVPIGTSASRIEESITRLTEQGELLDDSHGGAEYRRHLLFILASEARQALLA